MPSDRLPARPAAIAAAMAAALGRLGADAASAASDRGLLVECGARPVLILGLARVHRMLAPTRARAVELLDDVDPGRRAPPRAAAE